MPREKRRQLSRHMRDNPSLAVSLDEALRDATATLFCAPSARPICHPTCSWSCPWSFDQVIGEAFWPD